MIKEIFIKNRYGLKMAVRLNYEYDNNMTDEEIEERIQELERLQEQKKRKKEKDFEM